MTNKSSTGGFQGALKTSSKIWEDFNVDKAFIETLKIAQKAKAQVIGYLLRLFIELEIY